MCSFYLKYHLWKLSTLLSGFPIGSSASIDHRHSFIRARLLGGGRPKKQKLLRKMGQDGKKRSGILTANYCTINHHRRGEAIYPQ